MKIWGLNATLALFLFYSPAIILLFLAVLTTKRNPDLAKKLFIAAVLYALISTGICFSIFL